MSTASKPQGKTMYVVSKTDRDWLLNVQRKLYRRSWDATDYVFLKLWGLVTDPRNLRTALGRVARNKGKRTAGVDGITVRKMLRAEGGDVFVANVRAELRSGTYVPSPVRRVLIPKSGKPGEFRALGIPTVKDRVVQAAMKNIMEPIFEADFYPVSYGFRPGKSAHGALEHLRVLMRPKDNRDEPGGDRRLPYQVAIEGDIKGCFDNISRHGLMCRVRRRIGDAKVNRLLKAFLKSGILSEGQFIRAEAGTPQGGILSPLLANIALSVIEERYKRHVWPRHTPTTLTDEEAIKSRAGLNRSRDKPRGRIVAVPIRYADDFIILISAPPGPEQHQRAMEAAVQEKAALAEFLRGQLNLELSETKTMVTPVTERLRFLGHHVRVRHHPDTGKLMSAALIPKDRSHRLRMIVKAHFRRSTIRLSLAERLKQLNPKLRGWCNFYRHAGGAKRIFSSLDWYVWWTILRWLRKKHRRPSWKSLKARYGGRKPGGRSLYWEDGGIRAYQMAAVPVRYFQLGWLKPPKFAVKSMESPVRNESGTPGSGTGAS